MAAEREHKKDALLSIREDLKNRKLEKCYLLYGEERYLIDYYRRKMSGLFGEMALDVFDMAPDDGEIIDILNTYPFTEDPSLGRLVVIKSSGWFKKAVPEKLNDFFKSDSFPDFSHVLFVEDDVDKRSSFYKTVNKTGRVCEISFQEEKALLKWEMSYLKNSGKEASQADLQYLIGRTGRSMYMLSSELDKLIAFSGDRKEINREDIDGITVRRAEDRVFDMISEAMSGNSAEALKIYGDLLMLSEAPMKIFVLIRRNINSLLTVKELKNKGCSENEGALKAGLSPWAYRKLSMQAEKKEISQLEEMLKLCLRLDEAIKTGNITDRAAAETILFSCS